MNRCEVLSTSSFAHATATPTSSVLRRRPPRTLSGAVPAYSHSMVAGGLLVTSSTTRLISRTSLVMRLEMRASTS